MSVELVRVVLSDESNLSHLGTDEKSLLIVLAWHAHDDGAGMWAGQARLASELNKSERAIRSTLRKLEGRGLIVKVAGHSPSQLRGAEYQLLIPGHTTQRVAQHPESPASKAEESSGLDDGNPEVSARQPGSFRTQPGSGLPTKDKNNISERHPDPESEEEERLIIDGGPSDPPLAHPDGLATGREQRGGVWRGREPIQPSERPRPVHNQPRSSWRGERGDLPRKVRPALNREASTEDPSEIENGEELSIDA